MSPAFGNRSLKGITDLLATNCKLAMKGRSACLAIAIVLAIASKCARKTLCSAHFAPGLVAFTGAAHDFDSVALPDSVEKNKSQKDRQD